MTKTATIKTRMVGQHFGTCADVKSNGKVIHSTETRPYGFTRLAYEDAELWCESHGYTVDDSLRDDGAI